MALHSGLTGRYTSRSTACARPICLCWMALGCRRITALTRGRSSGSGADRNQPRDQHAASWGERDRDGLGVEETRLVLPVQVQIVAGHRACITGTTPGIDREVRV